MPQWIGHVTDRGVQLEEAVDLLRSIPVGAITGSFHSQAAKPTTDGFVLHLADGTIQ